MKRDIVITSASGYTFDQLRYWLNSLDHCGFEGERVVVVGNGDLSLIEQLEAKHCTVVTRKALIGSASADAPPFVDHDMSIARFLLFWRLLSDRSEADTRYVIAADIRDAVFQLDPAQWLARNLAGKKLVVASEGLTYGDQPWNRQSMHDAFDADVARYMSERLVWNCGTIGGELSFVRDLALNIFIGCSARNVPYSDQASLNVLLSLEAYREHVLFDRGDIGWGCQAGTMVAVERGPDLSYRFRGLEPLFDGDTVYTATGAPFCIVHQYDRIPYWKQYFENKFG